MILILLIVVPVISMVVVGYLIATAPEINEVTTE